MPANLPYWAQNLPSGPDYYVQFLDFDRDSDEDQLSITRVGTSTDAVSDAAFGEMLTTNDTNDNDSTEYQWEAETIRFNGLGKTYWLICRAKFSDATDSDVRFGAMKTDTTFLPGTGAAGVSDGVWWGKDDDDTNLDGVHAFNAATFPDDYSKNNALATLDTSYHTYAIRIVTDATTLGTAAITWYFDGVAKTTANTTGLVHDEELALSFGIQNGAAAAKTATWDYVGFAVER